MKTAHSIPRIGLARAKAEHLHAVNEPALHVVGTPARAGLMNPDFKYTRAAETDIRKTFKRIRAQQKAQGEA
jgi:hypothetical protein